MTYKVSVVKCFLYYMILIKNIKWKIIDNGMNKIFLEKERLSTIKQMKEIKK